MKEKLKNLPSSPGVYLMKDSNNRIMYVGKSKNLKQRVHSYFYQSKGHSRKIKQLVNTLQDFDYIQTDTEFEAFLLECRLIQEIKPYFNRLLKNPLAYTYISFLLGENHQKIEITNNPVENGLSFGPFTSRSTVDKAIIGLKTFYKIDCQNPSKNSPCLNYSLGLCIGICMGGSANEQHNKIINKIISLLKGTDTSILEEMHDKMIQAAERFDFNTAAKYRDYIHSVRSIVRKEQVKEFTETSKNFIILEYLDSESIKLFFIKGKDILHIEKLTITKLSNLSLANLIVENIFHYFKPSSHTVPKVLKKEEIDRAQIIYNYIKSSQNSYLIIPEKWLETMTSEEMNRKVIRFLENTK